MSAGSLDLAEGNALTKFQPTKVNSLSMVDKKLYLLNEKMDKLLHFQEDLTGKLQRVDRGIADVGSGINKLTVSRAAPGDTDAMQKGLKVPDSAAQADVQSICSEVLNLMKAAQLDASKHKERLAKIEKRVDTLDKVITFVGEVLKNSKVVDFILKGIVPWKKGSLLEIPVEVGLVLLFFISLYDIAGLWALLSISCMMFNSRFPFCVAGTGYCWDLWIARLLRQGASSKQCLRFLKGAGQSCNECEKEIATVKENSASTSAQSSAMSPKLVTGGLREKYE